MKAKQGSTIFLRLAIFILGIIIIALYALLTNRVIVHPVGHLLYPVVIAVYATGIPFFIALHQALKLLIYIDENKAFSKLSVNALKNIKYCAIAISILYIAIMPFLYLIADREDAPGIIIIGAVFVFAPSVIATFAALLQKLLQKAIDIKSDNDLTI